MSEPERPKSVTVCAILNFVFAGLGLTCAGIGLALKSMAPANVHAPYEDMWIGTWQKLSIPIGVVLIAALVASGLGLLQRKPWGRTLALVYAWWSVVSLLLQIFIISAYQLPHPELFLPEGAPAASAMFVRVGAIVGLLIGAPYPIALLVIMNKPHVVRWFQGPSVASE